MLHSLVHDGLDMIISKGIEHRFSFPSVLHKLHLLEHPELMGNRGLRHSKNFRQITNTSQTEKEHIKSGSAWYLQIP